MFRIEYAPRDVFDSRGDAAPIPAAQIKVPHFAYFDEFATAYRQAVSDVYHGRVVVSVQELRNGDWKVKADRVKLATAAGKMRDAIAAAVLDGFGEKGARQRYVRGVKP